MGHFKGKKQYFLRFIIVAVCRDILFYGYFEPTFVISTFFKNKLTPYQFFS